MAKLTTAALAAHELGLAATFGGIVFGQAGLGPSVGVLRDENDRSRVLDAAWRTYSFPKTLGLVAAAATWLIGRSVFSGRFLGKPMRRLVVAKDVALGITVLSGIGSQVCGQMLAKEQPFPVGAKGKPSPGAPDRAAELTRALSILGTVQMFAAGAALVLTSALNLQGQRNSVWRGVARLLP